MLQFPEDRTRWRRHGTSMQIQQMHKKRSIKTNGLRDSVIVGTKELDKSTK